MVLFTVQVVRAGRAQEVGEAELDASGVVDTLHTTGHDRLFDLTLFVFVNEVTDGGHPIGWCREDILARSGGCCALTLLLIFLMLAWRWCCWWGHRYWSQGEGVWGYYYRSKR